MDVIGAESEGGNAAQYHNLLYHQSNGHDEYYRPDDQEYDSRSQFGYADETRQHHEEKAVGTGEQHCCPPDRFGKEEEWQDPDGEDHCQHGDIDSTYKDARPTEKKYRRRQAHDCIEQYVHLRVSLSEWEIDAKQDQTDHCGDAANLSGVGELAQCRW